MSRFDYGLSDEEEELYAKLKPSWIFAGFLILANVLIPPKNIAVMMVAAPHIVEISKDVADSNRTKKLINILDNSLDYLDKKTKELK
jgi:hypothetical protein